MASSKALHIQKLGFERHYQWLLKNINIDISSGQLLQITGRNGSGKSTLLKIIAGLIEPHEGTIYWQGYDVSTHQENYKKDLTFIGYHNALKPGLTVYENLLAFSNYFHNKTPHDKVAHAITSFSLASLKNQFVQLLSAGQAKRVALARLLLKPAKLWVLDEPFTALDESGHHLLNDLVIKHLASGGSIILATHEAVFLPVNIKKLALDKEPLCF